MRGLYLDAFSGLSGDMMLGALVGLGVPLEVLEQGLAPLGLHGVSLVQRVVARRGIAATKIDVLLDGELAEGPGNDHDAAPAHAPTPFHTHQATDGSAHAERHGHGPGPAHTHRHWSDIDRLLVRSALAARVRERARCIFRHLAEAEARVHGKTLEEVTLHEVGAIDAIADIVGTAIGLEYLGVEQLWVGPLPLGTGFVRTAHGRLPIPAPATMDLLRDFVVRLGDGHGEMVTPTGAAIVAALATREAPPAFRSLRVAYGAGTRELDDRPNALRALLVETLEPEANAGAGSANLGLSLTGPHENAVVIEASIDDLEPELFTDAIEALRAAGAFDVTLSPLIMKLGRPGTLIQAITSNEAAGRVADVLLTETTTIGVRLHAVTRITLPREIREVDTPFGLVRVKVVRQPDGRLRAKPEHADSSRLARAAGVSVNEVRLAALQAAKASIGSSLISSEEKNR